jgi:hypothetical protein
MKKLMTLLISCLMMATAQSQTAELPTVNAEIGEVISVPLMVGNWVDVAAITLYITFNESKLTFLGAEPGLNDMHYTCYWGCIAISWAELTPVTLSGELISFQFLVNGTSMLYFKTHYCEVVQWPYPFFNDELTYLDVLYTNGLVYQPNKSMNTLKK